MKTKKRLTLTWNLTSKCETFIDINIDAPEGDLSAVDIPFSKEDINKMLTDEFGEHWQANTEFIKTVGVTEPKVFIRSKFREESNDVRED